MRVDITKEIAECERLLAMRLRAIIAGTHSPSKAIPMADLAGLGIIHEMIELMKEQVYHGNVVVSLTEEEDVFSDSELSDLSSPSKETLSRSMSMRRRASISDQLSLLQQQISSQTNKHNVLLQDSLKELRTTLLSEIRSSVQAETHHLQVQIQNQESKLSALRRQVSTEDHDHIVETGTGPVLRPYQQPPHQQVPLDVLELANVLGDIDSAPMNGPL